MVPQVNNICKTAWFHLRKIGKVRHYLCEKATECLIHAFVTSKLDNFNCFIFGLPEMHISKLQRVQNATARLVTLSPLESHIRPVLPVRLSPSKFSYSHIKP